MDANLEIDYEKVEIIEKHYQIINNRLYLKIMYIVNGIIKTKKFLIGVEE